MKESVRYNKTAILLVNLKKRRNSRDYIIIKLRIKPIKIQWPADAISVRLQKKKRSS